MLITPEDVEHVAALARLQLNEHEVAEMSVQLSSILEHMEALRQVVVEGVEPAASVIDQRAPLREDVGVPDLLHLGPGETILRAGGAVEHETLLWDANRGEARTLRSKEQSHDYRYFPDPDLPPLVIEREWRERIRASLPELPAAKSARFGEQYALAGGHVEVLTATRELADYYEEAVRHGADEREAANWIMGELLATLKARQCALADFPVRPAELAELLALLASGTLASDSPAGIRAHDGDRMRTQPYRRRGGADAGA